jgi:hypothetical protein
MTTETTEAGPLMYQTYQASVNSATTTRVASNQANALTAEESIAAQTVNAGNPSGRGVSQSADTQIRAANAAYVAAKQTACMLEQVAINNARSILQQTDTAPA